MAGMFGCSNQNNGASVALPFIRNGDDLCRRSIYMSTELLMALEGATWPSDPMSLFGSHDRNESPTVGSRDHFPLGFIAGIWAGSCPALL